MGNIIQLYNDYVATYTFEGIILISLIGVLFLIQMYYYLRVYGRIVKYRNKGDQLPRDVDGISVVLVVREDYLFLENTLPLLLTQDFDNFEVVVVDVGSNEDFNDSLQNMKLIYPNLTTTKFEQDPRFPISNKMALNVGIKAARNEFIVITTTDSKPTSQRWLSLMAKGFAKADVVIGYCGIERTHSLSNNLIRATRMMVAVRYLASAIRGVPYRAMIQNMGITRTLYFSVKGFDHLNMNIGEDDLFIQRIATRFNTAIVMHPNATMIQSQWGGLSIWRRMRRFYGFAVRYYPAGVKRYIAGELTSRMVFFLAVAVAVITMPFEIRITVGAIWLLRLLVVEFKIWRIGRRLGEHGLLWVYIFHDLIAPFDELNLAIALRLRKIGGIWR